MMDPIKLKENISYIELLSDDDIILFIAGLFDNTNSEQCVSEIDPNNEYEDIFRANSSHILYDLLVQLRKHCKDEKIYIFYSPFYDDRYYRSSFSLYYFGKHFVQTGLCSRLFLFDGGLFDEASQGDLSFGDYSAAYSFSFIGSIVKKPIQGMEIGRTIINPNYLFENKQDYIIRTACYSETMFGIRVHVYGFPYSMQDGETVTCAETTILNIIDYFSRRYQEYRAVYPSEISKIAHLNSYDRNIPAKGLTYQKISKILMEVGFYPRLYAVKYWKERFLAILYSYVSSGIPVAMGIESYGMMGDVGHSIIAIGVKNRYFSTSNRVTISIKDLCIERIPNRRTQSTTFISVIGNSGEDYVFMDDGRAPYSIAHVEEEYKWNNCQNNIEICNITLKYGSNPYDCRDSSHSRTLPFYESTNDYDLYNNISFLTVPLSKDMAMEADDAIQCFKNIIGGVGGSNGLGYVSYINSERMKQYFSEERLEYLAGDSEKNPLLLRIFLCAARSLKRHRFETTNKSDGEEWLNIYRKIHMPRYVWVCELYTLNKINSEVQTCIGEVILDATTSNSHKLALSNVISIYYPGMMVFRSPLDDESKLVEMMNQEINVGRDSDFTWQTLIPFRIDDNREKC